MRHASHAIVNILLFAALPFFCACERNAIYNQYRDLPNAVWQQEDTLTFSADIPQGGVEISEYIALRHRKSYGFSDLSLTVASTFIPRDSLTGHTIYKYLHLPLTEAGGKWLGTGMGSLLELQHYVSTEEYKEEGRLVMKVFHNSPHPTLEGIENIGIKLILPND